MRWQSVASQPLARAGDVVGEVLEEVLEEVR